MGKEREYRCHEREIPIMTTTEKRGHSSFRSDGHASTPSSLPMTLTCMYSPGIPIAEDVGGRAGVNGPDRIHVLETVIVQRRGGILLRESLEYRLMCRVRYLHDASLSSSSSSS